MTAFTVAAHCNHGHYHSQDSFPYYGEATLLHMAERKGWSIWDKLNRLNRTDMLSSCH